MSNTTHTLFNRNLFIECVKKSATKLKKQYGEKHADVLDAIASKLGYSNWSLFHKDILKMPDAKFDEIKLEFKSKFIPNSVKSKFNEEEAVDLMNSWVRNKFTPLIDFAFYDSESSNGYAWNDEDISMALQEEFLDQYPLAFIEKVAQDLELNYGPWGIEKY